MSAELLGALKTSQNNLLAQLRGLSEEDGYKQYCDDLSPVAWHVGHCAFVEEYWIREIIHGDASTTEPLKDLYFPELSPKSLRAERLPPYSDMLDFATGLFTQHLQQLKELTQSDHLHPLLRDAYLMRFLLQHSLQHQETVVQSLYLHALQTDWGYQTQKILAAKNYSAKHSEFNASDSEYGNHIVAEAYDNERPVTRRALAAFKIGTRSVNNAEYLGFMESGGYASQSFWSPEGWRWLQKENVGNPAHWRRDDNNNWIAITENGAEDLQPNDAVYGLNRYEAEAFASFAGGRLPHEFEWEHAATPQTSITKQAWDWCGNAFFPYPNYTAYPYDGYSQPWFDGNHYTLRGGSRHTGNPIRRTTFRNFYTPEKRHVFAGVRVAFDT